MVASFHVFASPDMALPFYTWSNPGTTLETPAGSGPFPFTDPQATNNVMRVHRASGPWL